MEQRQRPLTGEMALFFVFSGLFLAMLCLNLFVFRLIHWISLAVFLTPALVYLLLYLVQFRRKVTQRVYKTALVALSTFFILLSLVNTGIAMTAESLLPSSNTLAYNRILKSYGYPASKGVAHFPEHIPSAADHIVFYQMPGFGPGGTQIALRYATTPDAINDIYDRASKTAQRVLSMKEQHEKGADGTGVINLDHFFDSVGYNDTLPDDFELIILKSKSTGADLTEGYAYGLAICKPRREVIYFYADWN